MLDMWLNAAYDRSREEKAEADLLATMQQLPEEELRKIAMGVMCSSDRGPEWLDHFKGTPLFEQAIQLEQEDIQLEMARRQQSEQDRAMWDMRDQLSMKKRLLDIQLAQLEQQQLVGGPAPAPAASPASTAPTPEAAPAPGGPAPAGAGAPAPSADPTNPKSVTVKMGEAKTAGEPGPLTTGETMASLLGGPVGYFGAKKGKEHSGEALKGGLRGVGGYMMGMVPGTIAGNVAASALGGNQGGQLLGGLLGGQLGGYAGYKLLTRKYNGEPHRDATPPEKEEGKQASAEMLEVVAWARDLARADHEKLADAVAMIEGSVVMGQALAKTGAFDPTALLGQAKGLAGRAAGAVGGFLKREPAAAAGAIGGGLAGAAAGLQKDEHGQRSLGKGLVGGLVGAGGGALGAHAASNIGQSVSGGAPLGASVKNYASHWGEVLRNAVSGAGAAPTAAPAALLTG